MQVNVVGAPHPPWTSSDSETHESVTVEVTGAIDDDTATEFVRDLRMRVLAHCPVVVVEISSEGGEINALVKMLQAVRECQVPVVTYVPHVAMSAAACLFAMGAPGRRFVGPAATLMFHRGSMAVEGDMLTLSKTHAMVERQNEYINNIVEDNCGLKRGYFDSFHSDHYLTAQEALEVGIATSLGTLRLSVDVRPRFALSLHDGAAGAGEEVVLQHRYAHVGDEPEGPADPEVPGAKRRRSSRV